VLGLLVSEGGYPPAYSIHEGNKYEGPTMLLTDRHKSIAVLFDNDFWEEVNSPGIA
jgi:hypothetical protein